MNNNWNMNNSNTTNIDPNISRNKASNNLDLNGSNKTNNNLDLNGSNNNEDYNSNNKANNNLDLNGNNKINKEYNTDINSKNRNTTTGLESKTTNQSSNESISNYVSGDATRSSSSHRFSKLPTD